jgi:hypothetical protein
MTRLYAALYLFCLLSTSLDWPAASICMVCGPCLGFLALHLALRRLIFKGAC